MASAAPSRVVAILAADRTGFLYKEPKKPGFITIGDHMILIFVFQKFTQQCISNILFKILISAVLVFEELFQMENNFVLLF